jgi:hypothetical protein
MKREDKGRLTHIRKLDMNNESRRNLWAQRTGSLMGCWLLFSSVRWLGALLLLSR